MKSAGSLFPSLFDFLPVLDILMVPGETILFSMHPSLHILIIIPFWDSIPDHINQ
jgi:hypothetical protein